MREREEEEEKWKQKYEDWLTICYVSFSSLSLLDRYIMGQREKKKKRPDSLSSEEKLKLAHYMNLLNNFYRNKWYKKNHITTY